jgi:hypothetical protein
VGRRELRHPDGLATARQSYNAGWVRSRCDVLAKIRGVLLREHEWRMREGLWRLDSLSGQ